MHRKITQLVLERKTARNWRIRLQLWWLRQKPSNNSTFNHALDRAKAGGPEELAALLPFF